MTLPREPDPGAVPTDGGDLRPTSWWADAGVLLVATATVVPYLTHDTSRLANPHWVDDVGSIALVALLAWCRRRPVPGFVAIVVLGVGLAVWDPWMVRNLVLPCALYTVTSRCSRRTGLAAAGVLEAFAVALAVLVFPQGFVEQAVLFTGMVLAAAGLGLYTATRRDYIRQLHERADRLERERDQADRLAAAAERARIAREMHDIVAHHLTVMVALSDAAGRLIGRDPDRAASTIAEVSDTGRVALRDTRRLLGVLNDDSTAAEPDAVSASWARPGPGNAAASRRPLPGITDLDQLVDHVRAAGLAVRHRSQGDTTRLAALPADTQLAIYRLVQEALTNTMKHAPSGSRATVSVRVEADHVTIHVDDDGAGHPVREGWRPGRGTSGMRTRIAAAGGQLRSEPGNPVGWRVTARLPLDPSAPTDPGASRVR